MTIVFLLSSHSIKCLALPGISKLTYRSSLISLTSNKSCNKLSLTDSLNPLFFAISLISFTSATSSSLFFIAFFDLSIGKASLG